MFWYHTLDIFFLIFHAALVLVNLFGWMWKPIRKLNLITLLLTFLSWTILGIFYGWGYCPLTDWHWEVLRKMGETELPLSYITYMINRVSGFNPNEDMVAVFTAIFLGVSFLFSIGYNTRDFIVYKRKRNNNLIIN